MLTGGHDEQGYLLLGGGVSGGTGPVCPGASLALLVLADVRTMAGDAADAAVLQDLTASMEPAGADLALPDVLTRPALEVGAENLASRKTDWPFLVSNNSLRLASPAAWRWLLKAG